MNSSRIPPWKAEESVEVTSNWTRKSSWKSGSTSSRRPADVTLCTTSST
ncbi:hypothetical protein OG909_17230 [Streptomyces sp. NBC_01754]|nr:hypothetical protein [Streptomyces sp. NBC_01754]WSC93874.1 hypothetical protein OG909_17230 [Streptomyces sp. NBC_01754]